MSSIVKLQGIVFSDDFHSSDQASPRITVWQDGSMDARTKTATLIIGKAFTEEEVRAFINDLKDQTMSLAVEQSIDRIAAKHGIKL